MYTYADFSVIKCDTCDVLIPLCLYLSTPDTLAIWVLDCARLNGLRKEVKLSFLIFDFETWQFHVWDCITFLRQERLAFIMYVMHILK